MSGHALTADDPARFPAGAQELDALAAADPSERRDMWPAGLSRSARGEMELWGRSVADLISSEAKTPVFVMDVADFRARARAYKTAFDKAFGSGRSQVHYAGKAFLTLELARIAAKEGLGLDTASAGELTLAIASGCDPKLIGLHGNGKSEDLLHHAVTAGIGRIIVDSLAEIERLQRVLDGLPQAAKIPVMVRITTGVHAGGHEFIATAHEDQKFGLSLLGGASEGLSPEHQNWTGRYNIASNDSPAMVAVKLILADERLDLAGLHSHIGSQILDFEGFKAAAKKVLEFRAEIERKTGYLVDELDLGGGYGVAYTPASEPGPNPEEVAQGLYQTVQEVCNELDEPMPFVSVEPGRSLVASTMITLYRVLNIKDQPVGTREDGSIIYRRYVAVDGGMSDNIRPALYEADYTAALANRVSEAPLVAARVVGSHCESGDIVVHNVALPSDLDEGDILAVPMVGAYGWSMSSNYNWFTRLGVLGVDQGSQDSDGTPVTKWLLEPETVDSMLAHFDPAYREYLNASPQPNA